MSESFDDSTEHDHRAPGADQTADGGAHGRHRGGTASDDAPEAAPHGRHRR
ncbi:MULTISPECIES: hypothetical protein [unclassified Kitasatospora]|uniref:hypothetical protein n=1 Tax=unclassified Kitasatospora TaxID=2633591 RepID=UPI0038032D25